MLIKNQNYPDFVKTRFLLAGFYCTQQNGITNETCDCQLGHVVGHV